MQSPKPDQLIVVCAANYVEAENWRQEEGLPHRRAIYASSPRVLVGLAYYRVVTLPGFWHHPHALAISDVLRRNAARMRVDDPRQVTPLGSPA